MKRLFFILLLFCCSFLAHADGWGLEWYGSTRMTGSSGQYLPFYARTGEDGILPIRSSGLLTAGADVGYRHSNGLFFDAGANLVGALAMKSPLNTKPVYGVVDRLYLSGGWKMLHLDVGMKPRERSFSDLSISGGDILYSRNARNLPGINAWSDWIYFEKGHWIGIKGHLSHYQFIDNRCVSDAFLHSKAIAVKVALGHKVDLTAGFDHYAQWGGNSETLGQQLQGFKDYVNVFFGRRGGEDALMTDQMNVFGNHLGREWGRLDWRASRFTLTFQYDKPFEDNSGMTFKNFPDGVWSLQFAFRKRYAFVTDVIYEFINTTWQSGSLHDRPATEEELAKQDPSDPYYGKIVMGGRDNYFNNSPYNSGWTNYGRVIGLPLLVAYAPGADGKTRGILNNRVRGHHAGVAGVVAGKVPYKLKLTFTENFGTYGRPLENEPWQLSMALEAGLDQSLTHLPLHFSVGVYGDVGKLYQNSVGLMLKMTYADRKYFR